MYIIKPVPTNKVAFFGYRLVKKAKSNLRLTMIIADELSTTSPEYLKLLKRKIAQGLDIKRIGFGPKNQCLKAYKQLTVARNNFAFKCNPDMKLVQRLLIVDEKEMLFAVYQSKSEKSVFYTQSKPIIKGFANFFDDVFKRSEFINYNLVK